LKSYFGCKYVLDRGEVVVFTLLGIGIVISLLSLILLLVKPKEERRKGITLAILGLVIPALTFLIVLLTW